MTRFAIMLTGYLALGALVIPAFVRPAPRLIWNASASVPVGLYAARPVTALKRGDLVAAMPPEPLARMMAERRYLPLRTPMLKHVAALQGQRICRVDLDILVDGERVARARFRDRIGRPMPVWQGCRTLAADEVLLLNPAAEGSFDGRYFGPVSTRSIRAVLTPLWLADSPEPASRAVEQSSISTSRNGADHDQDR